MLSSGASTDVTVDVSGWYLATGVASSYNPIVGAHVMDTRTASVTGTCVPSPCVRIAAGATVELRVVGTGAVPANGVGAVAVDLTVIFPAGAARSPPTPRTRPAPSPPV